MRAKRKLGKKIDRQNFFPDPDGYEYVETRRVHWNHAYLKLPTEMCGAFIARRQNELFYISFSDFNDDDCSSDFSICEIFRKKDQVPQGNGMNEWISVKERLPEEWKPVLGAVGTLITAVVDVMVYIGRGKWRVTWNHDMIEGEVTHWMPLPDPPEVKE